MKRTASSALVLLAGISLALSGCGKDDTIEPTPDHVDAWAGEYSGSADFLLSNGRTGSSNTAEVVITAVSPKQVSLAATVEYPRLGSTRSEEAFAGGLLTPTDPERFTEEVRTGGQRTVFILERTARGVEAHITTSSRRYDGGWVVAQQLIMDVR